MLIATSNVRDSTPERRLTFQDRGVLEVMVAAVTFLCYTPALGLNWVWDDRIGVLENPFVTDSLPLTRYFSEPFWNHVQSIPPVYYRPVFLLWFRLNWLLFGKTVLLFHLTTVLVHVGVTLLVFAVAEKLTKDRWAAFIAALLFGVHPVHVESVAWISGVADPLLALYYLAALLGFMKTFDAPSGRVKWFVVSLVFFTLALLQKEPAVTLPAVVLAYSLLRAEGTAAARIRQAVITIVPYAVITAGYFFVRSQVLHYTAFKVAAVSLGTMWKTWPALLGFYLRMLVWPVGFSPYYDVSYVEHVSQVAFWGPLLVLAVIAAAIVMWALRRRALTGTIAFLVFAGIIALGPAMYIRAFQVGDFAHDRYLYLSSAPLFMLVALAVTALARGTRTSKVLAVAVGGTVLVLGALTVRQTQFWSSDLVLYYRSIAIAPHNNVALGNFGTALNDSQHYQEAAAILQRAVRENPTSYLNHMNLGVAFYGMGDFESAYRAFRESTMWPMPNGQPWFYLALTSLRTGRTDEALRDVQIALKISPTARDYHRLYGEVLRVTGDLQGTRRELETELRYHPDNARAQQSLRELQAKP